MKTVKELLAEAKQKVPAISVSDYLSLRDSGGEHVFLDVRSEEEWEEGHLENAINIPRGFLEFKVADQISDKKTPIITACAKGARAALAGETLKELGYVDVKYLEGGYRALEQAGIEN